MDTTEHKERKTFKIDFIKENINKIILHINKMKNDGNHDVLKHELVIMDIFPEIYDSYPFIVKKICKGDNLDMIYTMFENLEKVESGEVSLSGVETTLGNKLAKQYLDPVVKK